MTESVNISSKMKKTKPTVNDMIGFNYNGVFWEYTGMIVLRNDVLYQVVIGEKNLSSPKMLKYVEVKDTYIKETDVIKLN